MQVLQCNCLFLTAIKYSFLLTWVLIISSSLPSCSPCSPQHSHVSALEGTGVGKVHGYKLLIKNNTQWDTLYKKGAGLSLRKWWRDGYFKFNLTRSFIFSKLYHNGIVHIYPQYITYHSIPRYKTVCHSLLGFTWIKILLQCQYSQWYCHYSLHADLEI